MLTPPLAYRLIAGCGAVLFGTLTVLALLSDISHGVITAATLILGLLFVLELSGLLMRQRVRLAAGRVEYAWLIGPLALVRASETVDHRHFAVVPPAPFLSLRPGGWRVGLDGSSIGIGARRSRQTAMQLADALNAALSDESASVEHAHPADGQDVYATKRGAKAAADALDVRRDGESE